MTTAERIIALGVLLAACGAREDFDPVERERLLTLTGLGAPEVDRSNKYVGNPDAIRLGHRLFFDDGYSGKATNVDVLGRPVSHGRVAKGEVVKLSCATCHDPRTGGADASSEPNHISIGTGWGAANAPSVINAAYQRSIFWNGRADSLWGMIIPVVESGFIMNSTRLTLAWRMSDPGFKADYDAAFGQEFPLPFPDRSVQTSINGVDGNCVEVGGICPTHCRRVGATCRPRFPFSGKPGVDPACDVGSATAPFADHFDCMDPDDKSRITRIAINAAKAIAAYEATLLVTDSPFDRHLAGQPSLSDAAIRGARLYVGKAACLECHSGPLLSDREFHNTGVPEGGESIPTVADCPPGGACDCVSTPLKNCVSFGLELGLDRLNNAPGNLYRRDSVLSDQRDDETVSAFYNRPATASERSAWRTPSLRNVALTAPYMHNGIFKSLDEVIRFYNAGGSPGAYPASKDGRMLPLGLTDAEIQDLVAFLESLTGPPLPAALAGPPS